MSIGDCWFARKLETQRRREAAAAGHAHRADPPAGPPAVFDRAELLERVGGDPVLLDQVVALFIEDCPCRLAEIGAAVESGAAEAIRTSAHTLKGAAGTIAAPALFEASRRLERLGAEHRLDAVPDAWASLRAHAALLLVTLRGAPHALQPRT